MSARLFIKPFHCRAGDSGRIKPSRADESAGIRERVRSRLGISGGRGVSNGGTVGRGAQKKIDSALHGPDPHSGRAGGPGHYVDACAPVAALARPTTGPDTYTAPFRPSDAPQWWEFTQARPACLPPDFTVTDYK
ncbi:hypothetical protein DPEC_G00076630 [Dallia pectoralis]|uniref:Uncharacterized protein n=1 Tax=Dallia pectoralis TaxID=75939 RepID=A0ACC2H3J4_DALPE|nr:hypothetical protein DPEC_G00076630 [Dallia pectoralis]